VIKDFMIQGLITFIFLPQISKINFKLFYN
jgi:hypothetical protein